MPWLEMASSGLAAVHLADEVTKSKSLITRYAKRIIYLLQNGRVVIPVFGAGGVGKSTIGNLLLEQKPLEPGPYEESWGIEEIRLKGDIPAKVLVAPGQLKRSEIHWPELYEKLVDGSAIGMMNMVAYGYHSFGLNTISEHDLFLPKMTPAEFLDKYCAARRQAEIEMLERLARGISAVKRPLWMVTVVNKQDIWWKKQKEVRDHYEKGRYGEIIESLSHQLGARSFQHEFIPASLTVENFVTQGGQLLAEVASGYDLYQHYGSARFLLEKVDELAQQGKLKNV